MVSRRWLAVLVLAAVALMAALWYRGKAEVATTENKGLQQANTALAGQARTRAKTDQAQATKRVQLQEQVQAVQEQNEQERNTDDAPRATLSDSQRARLDRLRNAGNDAIRAASELH